MKAMRRTGCVRVWTNVISLCPSFLQPYRIKFDHPAYGGIYHQCVYMLCHQDDVTMRAGQLSKEAFTQGQTSSYMPHLSLLYSDIDEHVRSVSCWDGCELMHKAHAATASTDT